MVPQKPDLRMQAVSSKEGDAQWGRLADNALSAADV